MKTSILYKRQAIVAALIISINLLLLIPCQAQTTIFYGMTYNGGRNNTGSIIEFDAANNNEGVVWSFGTGTDGLYPTGDLSFDPDNKLFYGMAVSGGTNVTGGVIFSFNPQTNAENVVWNFGSGQDGSNPYGNLVFDGNNSLFYGMTFSGGTSGSGTIFTFDPSNKSENIVWSFGNGQDGVTPKGSLVFDSDTGLYYGMTYNGGVYGQGTIFNFNPSNNKENVLWNFTNEPDGGSPFGNLSFDATNKLLYGLTVGGGVNHEGSLVSFNPSNNRESVVWSFGGTGDGLEPFGSLVYDASNELYYGMTSAGGTSDSGAIFSFNPSNSKETVAWSLGSGTDGAGPYGDLTFEPDSNLFYGMTRTGGKSDVGAIIKFNPTGNKESVVWSFGTDTDGQYPSGDLVLYNPNQTAAVHNVDINPAINIFPNPSNGTFTLCGLTAGQIVETYNCLGQMVNSFTAENARQQLDISSQSNGMYLVRVFDKDGTTVMQSKILKAN